MFAYCNNNPVMYVDPNGEVIIGICLLILGGVTLTVGLTSCTHSPAQPNESNESADNTDYSWADEDPFLSQGRHSTFDDALNSAADDLKVYANNHNKEVGVFIYELYGGYYVSLPQSGMQAISESVDMIYHMLQRIQR